MLIADSGLDYAAFNSAVVPECLAAGPLLESIKQAIRYFDGVKRPWSCWVCDDLLAQDCHRAAAALLWTHGLRLQAEHQGMIAESLQAARRKPPELDMRPVLDEETQHDFAFICAQVFSVPGWVARGVYGQPGFWRGGLNGWVAYSRGRAVSIAATAVAGGAVGVYSVGTLPDYRNRGLGEAVTRHAVASAMATITNASANRLILQSTQSGIGLYRRMGFALATRVSVYMTS